MSTEQLVPRGPRGKNMVSASSVEIDPERWRHAWYMRRLTMKTVSEMVDRSTSWANMVAAKGRCPYFMIDNLASELEEVTDDLLYEVASDRERVRIGGLS